MVLLISSRAGIPIQVWLQSASIKHHVMLPSHQFKILTHIDKSNDNVYQMYYTPFIHVPWFDLPTPAFQVITSLTSYHCQVFYMPSGEGQFSAPMTPIVVGDTGLRCPGAILNQNHRIRSNAAGSWIMSFCSTSFSYNIDEMPTCLYQLTYSETGFIIRCFTAVPRTYQWY